jgi:hypothetical protein
MPHMVIFRDAEGRPGYHQADLLEDAVSFVEHLRNEQRVSDTRVFSMQEVPLEFKSYWRVEVTPEPPVLAVVPPEVEPEVAPVTDEADLAEVVGGEPEPVASGAAPSSRFGLFGRN